MSSPEFVGVVIQVLPMAPGIRIGPLSSGVVV